MKSEPILIVGHYCHDTLYLPNGTRSDSLGGSASYISSVLSSLGLSYQVVSKVGPDFSYLSQVTQKPRIVQTARTTHFVADFSSGERVGSVKAVCEAIFPSDIPRGKQYEVALAVGIAGEVLPETLDQLAYRSRLLLCDMQALIRRLDGMGRVSLQRFEETHFYSRLNKISFLKTSRQEAQYMDLEYVRTQTTVLMTEGKEGCTVYGPDWQFHVPAFSVEEIDPTGAGDCFLAGFAAGLLRGLALPESVRLGNYFGSLAVGQVGVPVLSPLGGVGPGMDDRLVITH